VVREDEVVPIVGSARDITVAKQRELRRQREQLAVLNRLVRHDIRNDMTAVIGMAELLRDEVSDQARETLDVILETSEHTVELTEIVRQLVQVISEGGELGVEPIPLAETLVREASNADRRFANAEIEGPLPKVDVRANRLLGSVFRNLLNNAVQHNDKPTPRVHVTAETVDESVRVTVADNGPGIPEAKRQQIFERPGERTHRGGLEHRALPGAHARRPVRRRDPRRGQRPRGDRVHGRATIGRMTSAQPFSAGAA